MVPLALLNLKLHLARSTERDSNPQPRAPKARELPITPPVEAPGSRSPRTHELRDFRRPAAAVVRLKGGNDRALV